MSVGLCLVGIQLAHSQIPAFPGADGAAYDITGGRGGIVYHVTELDQNYSHGINLAPNLREGTLRYGLDDSNFTGSLSGVPRTIVFDVAGTFWLGRFGEEQGHNNGWDTQSRLNIGSNVTIAGQTAPGPVNIMGGVVKANNDNAIIRNVTIATGYGMRSFEKPDEDPPELPQPGDFPDSYVYDALDISANGIMIDHVSTLYATDETISANELADNVTIQYTNISQGQNYPQADAEGNGVQYTGHGLGSLLQAGSGARISVLNSLYAHQKGRLPRVGSEEGSGAFNDFRNNVFYNWFGTAGQGGSGQPSNNNFINNFYLAGPGGDDVSQTAGPDGQNGTADDIGIIVNKSGGTGIFSGGGETRVYASGNLKDTNKDGDPNDTSTASFSANLQSAAFDVDAGVTLSAQDAFENVLKYVGARWWERDYDFQLGNTSAIDTPDERIIHETYTGTGKIEAWADDPFNDDPNEGVEWRNLLSYRADTVTGDAPFARDANWDTDDDGMPNYWEEEHGLSVNAKNHNGDFDSDGYTNLEEYLNELAAWPAPGPIIFNGAGSRFEEILNWEVSGETVNVQGQGNVVTKTNWQPSRYDEAQINSGTVTLDSVGQHAGELIVATNNGDTATLRILDGWLKAENGVVIGAEAGANGTLKVLGGHLITPFLGKGPDGTFQITSGTLTADVVAFDLLNQGGTIAPGNSPGVTWVMGDFENRSGTIELELAGTSSSEFDRILVDGELDAGGTLSISLIDAFAPQAGDSFDLFDFSTSIGSFAFDLPALDEGLSWDTSNLLTTGVLSVAGSTFNPEDLNMDGFVDGVDLGILLGNWNQSTTPNMGELDGTPPVDSLDLGILLGAWDPPPNLAAATVPEPSAFTLLLGFILLSPQKKLLLRKAC